MSLLDELQRYSEGEEAPSPGDLARVEAALAQARDPPDGDGGDDGGGAGSGRPSNDEPGSTPSRGANEAGGSVSTVGVVAGSVAVVAIVAVLAWPHDEPVAASTPETPAPSVEALVDNPAPEPRAGGESAPPGPVAVPPESARPDSTPTVVDDDQPPRAAKAEARPASKPDLNALLERAQNQRAAGDAKAAAATYRAAIRGYPSVSAGRRALVALGDIQLNQLGRPKAALSAYERYLDKGSDPLLIQEAAYGRIRALRRLGRTDDERAAIDAFGRAHPNSPYAAALKKRLTKLDTPSANPELQSNDG